MQVNLTEMEILYLLDCLKLHNEDENTLGNKMKTDITVKLKEHIELPPNSVAGILAAARRKR